jgi:hypothetical protein
MTAASVKSFEGVFEESSWLLVVHFLAFVSIRLCFSEERLATHLLFLGGIGFDSDKVFDLHIYQ